MRVGERGERDRIRAEIHLARRRSRPRAASPCARRSADRPRPRTGRRARRRRAAAAARPPPPRPARGRSSSPRVTRWAITSVSVSVPNFAPLPSSSSRSSRKFSMMPLCTTASRSVACGWALVSFGSPCVAQRVWPMPIVPIERLRAQLGLEIAQLALGAPARQPARPPAWRRRRSRSRDIRAA